MKKDLKYFMQAASNEPEIITVEGIDRYKDENGDKIPFEIKKLTQEEIRNIYNKYTTRKTALDKRGNPIIAPNGEVAVKVIKDNERAVRHILAEAIVWPPLKDPALMESKQCVDITEMPDKMFPMPDEYTHVVDIVFRALGIGAFELDDDELIDEAKN